MSGAAERMSVLRHKREAAVESVSAMTCADVPSGPVIHIGPNRREIRLVDSSIKQARVAALRSELDDMTSTLSDAESVRHNQNLNAYIAAGRATDAALSAVCDACRAGATTKALCSLGDNTILHAMLSSSYASLPEKSQLEDLKGGIAFPTTVCVNQTLAHHSPLRDEESVTLRVGDVVKVHLGAHCAGFPALAGRTVLITAPHNSSVNGASAEPSQQARRLIAATNTALKGMTRLVRPQRPSSRATAPQRTSPPAKRRCGAEPALEHCNTNAGVTDFIDVVGRVFDVVPLEGVMSHRMHRWVIDGQDCIINRRVTTNEPLQDVSDCEFELYSVWCLTVAYTVEHKHQCVMADESGIAVAEAMKSDSAYKTQPIAGEQCTIYRRNAVCDTESLRLDAGEALLSTIRRKFGCFPFQLGHCDDPVRAQLGVHSLLRADLVDALPPMQCKLKPRRGKAATISARASCTVALLNKRMMILCGDIEKSVCAFEDVFESEGGNALDRVTAQAVHGEIARLLEAPMHTRAAWTPWMHSNYWTERRQRMGHSEEGLPADAEPPTKRQRQ